MTAGGVRKRVYASVSAVAAVLTMGGCFDACNLVQDSDLAAGPNPAKVGERVTVTTSFQMRRGTPAEVEFDLDGDGSLETKAAPGLLPGPQPPAQRRYEATTHRSYGVPATIAVRSVVTAVGRGTTALTWEAILAGRSQEVEIVEYHVVDPIVLEVQQGPNQPPLASFTVTPNPVVPEGQVTYDASESSDSDGQVVRYEWDLDGNGTYERDTGGTPTTTAMESTQGFGPYPKEYTAGLRVTDSGGETASTTREVIVDHPMRVGSAERLAQRLAEVGSYQLAPRLREVDPGELMINGDELIVQGRVDRGRVRAAGFPASLRRGKRRVRWTSTTDMVIDTTDQSGSGRGFALLRFPAGGRACMAFRVDVPPRGKAGGRARIVGGVGRATGLRGKGMADARVTGKGIAVGGRFDLGFGGKRNFRLGRSDCAPLRSP